MPDSGNYLKILEKLSDISTDVGVLKNEVGHLKEGMAKTENRLAAIEIQDMEQNKLLDKHIEGVATAHRRLNTEIEARKSQDLLVQRQVQEIDLRLKKAEVVPNTLKKISLFNRWAAGLIAVLAAMATIWEVVQKLR